MPFSPFALDSCTFSTIAKDFSTHFAEDQRSLRSFFSTLTLEPTQFQHEPDQRDFQGVLLTLLQQVPLEVDQNALLQQWPYFYERSIGCVGVLKDWLVRAVAATFADKQSVLTFTRLQEYALPEAQCESMAMEAASGEQELHYTASRRQHLWTILGMSPLTEKKEELPPKTETETSTEEVVKEKSPPPKQTTRRAGQSPRVLLWDRNTQQRKSQRNAHFQGQSWSFPRHNLHRLLFQSSNAQNVGRFGLLVFVEKWSHFLLIHHQRRDGHKPLHDGSGREQLGLFTAMVYSLAYSDGLNFLYLPISCPFRLFTICCPHGRFFVSKHR